MKMHGNYVLHERYTWPFYLSSRLLKFGKFKDVGWFFAPLFKLNEKLSLQISIPFVS